MLDQPACQNLVMLQKLLDKLALLVDGELSNQVKKLDYASTIVF